MDLIPARNKNLYGAHPDARSVIAHTTEKYQVTTANQADGDSKNHYPEDSAIGAKPRGGELNVWLSEKPYVGQNASIYVMLLDNYGEMSGVPIEINLKNAAVPTKSYLSTWAAGEQFIAFDKFGKPMKVEDTKNDAEAAFDDQVAHYVDVDSAVANWFSGWGEVPTKTGTKYNTGDFVREIGEGTWTQISATTAVGVGAGYKYLLQPSGGVAQPKCYREGSQFVYKVNVPSILQQDIVLLDYYVEHRHDAAQVSILPDKFAPYMYVEGSSLVRRASDGVDLPVEFVIPKFKISTALTFTLTSTGDASTFTFQGDAYPDYSKFDMTRKVFADVQILNADDNYDGAEGVIGDPTDYRRYRYNEDTDGEYMWKDPTLEPHSNLDYSDAYYNPNLSGPITYTENAPTVSGGTAEISGD